METVILAGGLGTRISEESHLRPKPMIEIGGQPILWHIMKYYSGFGYNDFIICTGYRGYFIKEYFADYYLHTSNVTFDFSDNNRMTIHNNVSEPWRVTIVDTGINAQTGCRIKRIGEYLKGDRFFLTYGDGVSNIDLNALLKQHSASDCVVTISSVQPAEKFGVIEFDDSRKKIASFHEKSKQSGSWINAGFMVAERAVFDYLNDNEDCIFERAPLEQLCSENKLGVFVHDGFWQCMDTQRDKELLENLWLSGRAQWKIWM
jgi:glucose-1-phosphate cytidylyltransferase